MAEHGDVPSAESILIPNPPGFKCKVNAGCWADPQEGLYLRADDRQTYEIAVGHKVSYVESTADGETVYLTSTEQLTSDDTDASSDLFVWHESDPGSLTRVSIGSGGSGNSDSCSVAWTQRCDVRIISLPAQRSTGIFGNGYSDNPVASDSGDIYFESPEQLDGAKGEPEQVSLYVYRHNAVQYVATLKEDPYCPFEGVVRVCSENPVGRMQITRDGSRAAFVTASKLTSYDNAGQPEMYTFTPDIGKIDCVSCRPDGHSPTSEVVASQNGLFLTEDGRTFFSTADPLVPRDTNEAEDVYEYTEGKAQLISAGIGKVGYGGASARVLSRFGLIGVSANGTDVYFATSDNLVTQDRNGPELKIYDARTGGGFPAEVSSLKCEAAEECHAPTGSPPGLPADRTSASLGKAPKRHAAQKKKRGKKHSKKHAKKKTKRHAKEAKKQKSRARQGGDHRG
jgi:hypothetical protein